MSIAEKLATIAENEPKVYDTGKQAMNEAWWKAHTNNGTRTGYGYGFAQMDFSYLGGFNPPIQIKPHAYSSHVFWGAKNTGEITADKLDLSQCTTMDNIFLSCDTPRVEILNTKSSNTISGTFGENTTLKKIDKVILKNDGSQTFNQTAFGYTYALENIAFEGVIGNNIWFTNSSKLTRDSATSIFKALKDYSSEGGSHTIDLHTSCINKLSDADKAIATQKGWTIS